MAIIGRFQDPPQSSLPAVHEVRTGPHDQNPRFIFTPVWFKWFLDLVRFINMSGGIGGAAPANSPFLTSSSDPTLTQERTVVAGPGIGITDGGPNSSFTISSVAGAAGSFGMGGECDCEDGERGPPGKDGASGGGGAATVTQTTVTLPAPARLAHSVAVADGTVNAGSKIIVSLAGVAPGAPNELEDLGPCILGAYPGAGTFDLKIAFAQPAVGPIVLNYMVG